MLFASQFRPTNGYVIYSVHVTGLSRRVSSALLLAASTTPMTDAPLDPYFHLPDPISLDNPTPQQCLDTSITTITQTPPITVSCGSCERIVGDSSSFICAVRRIGGIVFDRMLGVSLGDVLVTGMAGDGDSEEFDQQCLFRPVQCSKCAWVLGKMYTSVAAGVPLEILNKYTVSRCKVLFYTHGQPGRAIPLAESEEIMRQLHPEPDEVARNLQQVMSLLVYLKEEQDGIVRALRRVAEHCGMENVEVGGGGSGGETPMDGQEEVGKGWKDRVGKLEFEVERLRAIVGEVGVPVEQLGTSRKVGVSLRSHDGGDGDTIDNSPPPSKRQRLGSNKHPRKSPSLVSSLPPLPHSLVGVQTKEMAREIEIDNSESGRGGYSTRRKNASTNYKSDGDSSEGGGEGGEEEKDPGDVYSLCSPREGRQGVGKFQGQRFRYKKDKDKDRDRDRSSRQEVVTPKAPPERDSQPGLGRRRKSQVPRNSGGGND